MKVSPVLPFRIIYSMYRHQYLGCLLQCYAVQTDEKGRLSLQHQLISRSNANEFVNGMDKNDLKLIGHCDDIRQDAIVKRHMPRKMTTPEFFLRFYDPQRGDKEMQDAIESTLDKRRAEMFALLPGKDLFEMSNDGEPTWKQIHVAVEKAVVQFHFRRNEQETIYFPTVSYEGKNVEFIQRNGLILCNQPAWLLVDNTLYCFGQGVDGAKLRPFLNKKFIVVSRTMETAYYRKFIAPLVASFDVDARGFEIRSEQYTPVAMLTFREHSHSLPMAQLFGEGAGAGAHDQEEEETEESKIVFELKFRYGRFNFSAETEVGTHVYPEYDEQSDEWVFHRVQRHSAWEKDTLMNLVERGLSLVHGKTALPKAAAFSWMSRAINEDITEDGIILAQNGEEAESGPRYFLGKTGISIEIKEGRDWFDVYAVAKFGEYEVPFMQLRRLILQKKQQFLLPGGETAIIPEAWFTEYAELFALSSEQDGHLVLPRYQNGLVEELRQGNLAQVTISEKLEKLRDFREADDYPLPAGFKGQLRPYQKSGYDWMCFLQEYGFGGCLADDMGLGKTVQTLVLLLRVREQAEAEGKRRFTSLMVVPTSLIHNWETEAKKFAPTLRILTYGGAQRLRDTDAFPQYDIVLTTYGIIRSDADMFAAFPFHYAVLDESQTIKNPSGQTAKAVMQLRARHKLILTGTPLENSTMDLWSQMNFINPGLLGNQTFFKNEYLNPIEKKNDEDRMRRLHTVIKPFMLRRTKALVAADLPAKVENVRICDMTEEQETLYESTRSAARNRIMEQIAGSGVAKSQIFMLQALTRLRQLACHPGMTEPDWAGSSGKMAIVLDMLESVVQEGHKVLVFSQFVRHLTLLRAELKQRNLQYAYLDGAGTDRQEQVEDFQTNPNTPIFLISLKAGGTGLNLTAADYVFLLDPWWNPASEAQAIDRAHRIGQDKTVFIYRFITANTVEEKITGLQKQKQKLFADLISAEEGNGKVLTEKDILDLLG
ncbi:MAG: DEAD/DEAH box helicase [Bacteroidota bacterium]